MHWWQWDPKSNEIQVPPGLMRELGETELWKEFSQFESRLHSDDRERVVQELDQCACGRRADYQCEFRLQHRNGKHLWMLADGNREEQSEQAKIVGVLINTTARMHSTQALRERAVALEHSNQQLQKFVRFASHELKAPSRTIHNFVGLLARRYDGQLDEKASDWISRISAAAEHMHTTIKQLLDYCELGSTPAAMETVACDAILDGVLESLDVLVRESNLQVTRDPLPTVTGDPAHLHQLFQHLVSNAVKFSCGQGSRVHVSARRRDQQWLFSVADDGIGIPSGDHEAIFELFKRLHPRSEYNGSGAGLAICRSLIQSRGGEIWVESEPGRGSTFYFTILAAEA